MANYQKYTKGASGHMLKHYERAKDEQGEYLKFGNQDIDPARTPMNYNLAPEHDQLEFIHERLDEVYCMKRKDVNVMCTWVVTAPKDLEPEREREFFQEAYNFMADKYGQQNVVSAYVHMDEKTPHMHFCFMPIVADLKRGGEKVSAKECVTKRDLERFHGELQKHMEERGLKCSIINEATLEGNKAIKELKQGTAIKELQDINERREEAQKAYDSTLKEGLHVLNVKQSIQREIQVLDKELTDKKEELKDIPKQIAEQTQRSVEMAKIWYGDPEEIEGRAKKAAQQLKEKEIQLDAAERTLADKSREQQELQESVKQLSADKSTIEKQIDSSEKRLEALQGKILSAEEVKAFTVKKSLFGEKAVIEGTPEELQSLKATAERVKSVDELVRKANNVLKQRDSILQEAQVKLDMAESKHSYLNREADKIVSNAKSQANGIISQAKEKAESIISEAKEEGFQERLARATRESNLENKLRKYEKVLEASPELKEHFDEVAHQLSVQNRSRGIHR